MRKNKLIKEAKHTLIKPRKSLELPPNITFGTEIELEYCRHDEVKRKVNNALNNWKVEQDVTLICGAEIISPILRDNPQTWNELTIACQIAENCGEIYTYSNAGGHIHYGSQILNNPNHLLNFLKLWASFEDIIIRFSNGEYLNSRENLNIHARRCKEIIENELAKLNKTNLNLERITHRVYLSQCHALSTLKLKSFKQDIDNTIEIRCPNATFEPTIWQNNINFFAKLLKYAASDNFDSEKIESLNIDGPEIDIEKAYQLAQLIFDNDLDKLYFLRQYIKDGKQTKEYKKLIKSEKFIGH